MLAETKSTTGGNSMNYKIMTLELNRIDVCDLLLACLSAAENANDKGSKWIRLHDKIKSQLESFDREHDNQ